ncbi:hypothetical protein ACFLX5_00500 [Chloroflexota bacterium]
MWSEVKKTPSLTVAEMWKDLFEGEGVPSRVVPGREGEAVYRVLVPTDRTHVIEEILRKI